ncbi:MAG: sel1 repeat family protein, partial [Candidatus Accumulibacter sp.]|nr:sel1 repeat family protein [Accumulibacter sp.]
MISSTKQCPECKGSHCRKSRWNSSEEKQSHPGLSPYRCLDCSHRFLTPSGKEDSSVKRWVVLIVTLAVGMIVTLFAVPLSMGPDSLILSVVPSNDVIDDSEIKKAAENGDHAAQFKLGEALFQDPARTDKTLTQAMYWLEAAAKGGNAEAMVYLGRLLRRGVGVMQNFAQASFWIQAAARHGHPEGMLEMGRLYRDGMGVRKDLIKAYVWFNHAAAARNIEAVSEREAIMHILTLSELEEAQRLSLL